ncbi:MAG: hypothetical protein Q8R53_03710 [Nanoarchaeota archaeon]|nr:hypothetical protein [Nanoarchaeota archaeon]
MTETLYNCPTTELTDFTLYEFVRLLDVPTEEYPEALEELKSLGNPETLTELAAFGSDYQQITSTIFGHLGTCHPCLNMYTAMSALYAQFKMEKERGEREYRSIASALTERIMEEARKNLPTRS